jgi:hypothetical protein
MLGARAVSAWLNGVLALGAVAIVMGTVGGAYILSWRNGVDRAKRNALFLLTDKDLVVRRIGWPDVRIGLTEIKALHEQPGRLVVEGVDADRVITVPDDVAGYFNLRAELAKYGRIVKSPKRSAKELSYGVVCLLWWFSWPVVLLSRNDRIVWTAGAFALLLSAWFSFRIARLVRRSPRRYLFWVFLAASWVGALWVVYERISKL